MQRVLLTLALLSAAAIPGNLEAAEWKVDKVHSKVNFSVTHLLVAEVTGSFTDFDVTMNAEKDDFTDAVIEATIKTTSIDTENEKRDGHLRSDDFLNAGKFPEIKFKSSSIEKTGNDTYRISGTLTIRDVSKPIVLDTKYKGTVKDPWGNTRSAWKATGTINRFDYGVKWNAAMETGGLIVGENIDITLLMQLTKEQSS
jgi:polyisoprenoid-binding protein YceI